MELGARILKTGIAVVVALYVCRWLGLGSVSAIAALAAVLTIQPSLYRSWKHLLEQIEANLIGVSLSVGGVLVLGNDPIVIGLIIVLVIILNLRLRFHSSIELAIFSVVAVTVNPGGDYLPFALERFSLIMIGIFSSMLVNMLFLPPKYEDKLVHQIKEARDHMSLLLRNMIYQEVKAYPAEKKKVLESLKSAEEFYERFREERPYYFRKIEPADARKIAIFKRMIRALYKEPDVIRSIEHHRGCLGQLPPHLLEKMQDHIYDITVYHQKILGKYEGAIKAQHPHERSERIFAGDAALMKEMMKLYDPEAMEENAWSHLFPIIAVMSELTRQLDHLDKLVDVYCAFHKE